MTDLNLAACELLSDASLEYLQGLPLTKLCLAENPRISLLHSSLARMRIASLDLRETCICALGLARVANCPITELFMGLCPGLTNQCLGELYKMPLRQLDLRGRGDRVTRYGLTALESMSLLEYLDLGQPRHWGIEPFPKFNYPHMKYLVLGGFGPFSDEILETLEGNADTLQYLDLRDCSVLGATASARIRGLMGPGKTLFLDE